MELVKGVWKCLVSLFSIEKNGGMYIREYRFFNESDIITATSKHKKKSVLCFIRITRG